VKNYFRFCGGKGAPQVLDIPNVAYMGFHFRVQTANIPKAQISIRSKGIARHFRAEREQQFAQPRTFESSMSGYKHALAAPEVRKT
jgi:hypothetical protein